jgi:hypothetical protein
VLFDQRIDDRTRLHVNRMPVIAGKGLAILEVADKREVQRAPPGGEVAADLDAQQPWDSSALSFERAADNAEDVTAARL